MKQIPSVSDTLVVYGDFHGFSPEELFDHWVLPDLLTLWWPQIADNEPHEGGSYRFSWPDQNWYLQGSYTVFQRGEHLRFSWKWNHEPEVDEPIWVDVCFMAIDHGTRMSIFHGPYSDSEKDQVSHQGILEGWIHFGSRLAGLRVGETE